MNISIAIRSALAFCLLAGASSWALDADSVEKQANDKIALARKACASAVNAAADDAIRKYEALLKQETAAGHVEAAKAISEKIEAMKDLKADPLSTQSENPGDVDAMADATPNAKIKSDIRKRMRAFYICLAKDDYEGAKAYLDPQTVELVPAETIKGHLKVISGILTTAGIKKDSQIDVKDLTLTPQRNGAKVVPRWQGLSGDWSDGQAQYWIFTQGKWHLGDEKELKKFK